MTSETTHSLPEHERSSGNVFADLRLPDAGEPGGLVQASMEQVIAADPEVIVTWDRNFFDRVRDDPLWAEIEAVRENRVYLSPTAPFGWIDCPPSLNRMIGLKWMAGLLYPDRWKATCARTRATSTAYTTMSI